MILSKLSGLKVVQKPLWWLKKISLDGLDINTWLLPHSLSSKTCDQKPIWEKATWKTMALKKVDNEKKFWRLTNSSFVRKVQSKNGPIVHWEEVGQFTLHNILKNLQNLVSVYAWKCQESGRWVAWGLPDSTSQKLTLQVGCWSSIFHYIKKNYPIRCLYYLN